MSDRLMSDRLGWVLAGLAFAGYSAFSLWQWANFAAPSWDLGIFTQLLDRYRNFAEPIVAIKGPGYNLWGDHFHPILFLLTPIFALFPSGLTLLIVQNALFAVSIVPVTWLARRQLGRPGAAVALAYALSWGLANAVAVQFHEIAFAVPLLAFGLACYVSGRPRAAIIWIAALVFVKEDLGLTVAAFAGVGLWDARRASWSAASRGTTPSYAQRQNLAARAWLGRASPWICLGLWGVGWFVASVFFIIPTFNTAGGWDYTDRIDDVTFAEQLLGFATPWQKWFTLGLLILLGGIIALRSPLMVMIVPTLAWRFIGNIEHYWGWTWHYSAVLMPIVVVAGIDGYRRFAASRADESDPDACEPGASREHVKIAASAVALTSSLVMVGSGPLAHVAHGWYVWDPAGSQQALADLADVERERHERSAGNQAEGEQADAGGQAERLVVASDISHLAYLAPDYEVYWTGSMGNVIPQAWVVQLDEPVADKVAYAQARWGGTWEARVHGDVALLLPDGNS
ncbi:DUF2079 domain-containing protein [Trueperella bialowiezensis]|nr:DUF2079 domain-containing protein [Trueperella bialowiezensis]